MGSNVEGVHSGRKLRWVISITAFLAGLVIGLLLLREETEELTRENLARARTTWQSVEPAAYRIEYLLNQDSYVVTYRDGIVAEVVVNGRVPESIDYAMCGVNGIFSVLTMDLALRGDPSGPFVGRDPTMRVRYEPYWGFPEYYVRSGGGMKRSASIRVTDFDALSEGTSSAP